MLLKPSLTCFAFIFCSFAFAQIDHSCGFDHWLHNLRANDSEVARAMDDQYASWIADSRQQDRVDEVYTIPVVFHVVYNNSEQNLPDSVILSQLEVLNEDYRRLNANAAETRDEFLPVAADVGIEFALAEFDPEGNPTDGIVRVETNRESFELDFFSPDNTLDEVKFSETGGSDAWDTQSYLNIWVCNIAPGFGQIFGLAYPPTGLSNWPDGSNAPSDDVAGVIVHFTTVGRNNPYNALDNVAENDQGRTMVHEIGHYLGLRHIWGDAIFGDGCSEDDGISDTPNAAAADNYACNFNANSCTDAPEDFPDMIENYMDYSQDACMNLFTQEQADLMRFALTELRPGLLESGAVNVTENESEVVFEIFPNPVQSHLNVVATEQFDQVTLMDRMGRVLQVKSGLSTDRLELDLTSLASGTYFIQIESDKNYSVRPFLKH